MTAGGWLVPIVALRRHLGNRRHEHREGSLGELRVADTVVPADHDVTVDVVLSAIDGGIEVEGTVSAGWEAECRRCLRPVSGVLTAEVRELYRPPEHRGPGQHGPEHRGAEHRGTEHRGAEGRHRDSHQHLRVVEGEEQGEDDTYELGAEQLDLAPLARDAVLLGLPLAPLCRPDCAGLCPTCGAELADGDCDCAPAPPDARWAALDALRPARATQDGGNA